MTNWCKINNNLFYYKDFKVNQGIGCNTETFISFFMKRNYKLDKYLTKLYESILNSDRMYQNSFIIETKSIELHNCLIKSIDFDFNSDIINISVLSDFYTKVDSSKRRDEIIKDLLDEDNI
jgi:hypothetical protein